MGKSETFHGAHAKEYFLREQMKAIQTELGDKEGKGGEVEELREKIEQSGMPEETMKAALKELIVMKSYQQVLRRVVLFAIILIGY